MGYFPFNINVKNEVEFRNAGRSISRDCVHTDAIVFVHQLESKLENKSCFAICAKCGAAEDAKYLQTKTPSLGLQLLRDGVPLG